MKADIRIWKFDAAPDGLRALCAPNLEPAWVMTVPEELDALVRGTREFQAWHEVNRHDSAEWGIVYFGSRREGNEAPALASILSQLEEPLPPEPVTPGC